MLAVARGRLVAVTRGQWPPKFSAAGRTLWEQIERKAGSRQEMVRRFRRAGYAVSVATIGGWIRGEAMPPFPIVLWASEAWDVSLDELVKGQSLERSFADRLADHEERLTEQEEWLRELYSSLGLEMGAAVPADEAPNLALARLRREMDNLRETVERRLGGE